jgi:hypothetical protein
LSPIGGDFKDAQKIRDETIIKGPNSIQSEDYVKHTFNVSK